MKRDPKTGKLPPKKRNERALMLARQQRHTKAHHHDPAKLYAYKTHCTRCGITMSWHSRLRKYVYG